MHPFGLLTNGEKAEIINIIKPSSHKIHEKISESYIRLDEMGVLVGEAIVIDQVAPMWDLIEVTVKD